MSRIIGNKHWILASVAALTVSSGAFAADQAFEKELAREFPGAKTQILDTKEINGVKVHDVRIESSAGQHDAMVTENGDILLATLPKKASEIPPDVAAVSEGLFGKAATNVEAFVVSSYIVNITANGKGYELKLDGTGRVTDVDTKQQVNAESPTHQPKASAADEAKITKLVEEKFPGAKIKSIHQTPTSAGFYSVDFTEKGNYGFISLSEKNEVRSYASAIPSNELPKAVQAAVNEIKGAKINGVMRYTTHYWQLEENVNGDTLTMKVRPDGDIISVESREGRQTQEAATVSHKQHAGSAAAKKPS